MQIDVWQLVGVTGTWTAIIVALALGLHKIRRSQWAEIKAEIQGVRADLEDKIEASRETATREHAALVGQMQDITKTLGEHYVRKEDLHRDLGDIKDAIENITDAIANVGTRVDGLYQKVAWRKE